MPDQDAIRRLLAAGPHSPTMSELLNSFCEGSHSRQDTIKNILARDVRRKESRICDLLREESGTFQTRGQPDRIEAYLQGRRSEGADGVDLIAEQSSEQSDEEILQLAERYSSLFPEEAQATYEASLARLRDPDVIARGYCGLAWSQFVAGQYDAAEQSYRTALTYKENSTAYRGLGHVCCDRDLDFFSAREFYRTAEAVMPEQPDTLRALMQVNTRMGEWSGALSYCRRLLQHQPHERALYEEARSLQDLMRQEQFVMKDDGSYPSGEGLRIRVEDLPQSE